MFEIISKCVEFYFLSLSSATFVGEVKRKYISDIYIEVEHDKSYTLSFLKIVITARYCVLGEAGTPRPGTPSSVHSGELPATRVR